METCSKGEIMFVVYLIKNKINNKIYIGSKTLSKDEFLKSNYWGSGKLIKRAIKKYGIDNFEKIVIDECKNKKELHLKEEFWINYYNSTDKTIGYNISKYAQGGFPINDKKSIRYKTICQKISKSLKGKVPWNKGLKSIQYKLCEECKENFIPNNKRQKFCNQICSRNFFKKNYKHDKKTIDKIIKSNRNRKGEKRISLSQITKNKISKSLIGKNIGIKNGNSRSYKIISPDNKEIILHGGLENFCKLNNLKSRQLLIDVAKGIRTDYKGWKCYYLK